MKRRLVASFFQVGWLAAVALFPALPAVAAAPPVLTGVARDPAGNLLAGVKVEVFSPFAPAIPVGTAETGRNGRFRVARLAPGLYRLAARKPGYRLALDTVDTSLFHTLDVILHPVPRSGEPGADRVLPSAAWALRLPARSILEETGPEVLLAGALAGSPPARRTISESLAAKLEHVVSLGGDSISDAAGDGVESRMSLAGWLGSRTRLEVKGSREEEGNQGAAENPARREATALSVGLACQTGTKGSLDVHGYLDRRALDERFAESAKDLPVRERTWGYDAAWSSQLAPSSRMAVSLDFLDTALDLRDTEIPGVSPGGTVEGRRIGATGSYETIPVRGHQLRVGFRAQRLDMSGDLPPEAWREAVLPGFPIGRGWTVGIRTEDAWSVAGPWSLTYGVTIERHLDGPGRSRLIQRVGGAWDGDGLRGRLSVSYHTASGEEVDGGRADGAASPLHGPLGYEAEFEADLPADCVVQAFVRHAPSQESSATPNLPFRAAEKDRPFFSTDGDVAVAEQGGSLRWQAERITGRVSYLQGTADGILAVVAPYDMPVGTLDRAALRYVLGKIGVGIPAWGTDVETEYRSSREVPDWERRYVEIRIRQDLARSGSRETTWRLLVSARSVTEEGGTVLSSSAELPPVDARSTWRRLSAGIAVAF